MFSFFKSRKKSPTIPSFEAAPTEHLGCVLWSFLDRIKALDSSRFFENILSENDGQEKQSSCYIGNFRLLYCQHDTLTTIDWSIWEETENCYLEIAFLQRIDEDSEWFIISALINEELLGKVEQVKRLLIAMETYESFMQKRKDELNNKNNLETRTKPANTSNLKQSA